MPELFMCFLLKRGFIFMFELSVTRTHAPTHTINEKDCLILTYTGVRQDFRTSS